MDEAMLLQAVASFKPQGELPAGIPRPHNFDSEGGYDFPMPPNLSARDLKLINGVVDYYPRYCRSVPKSWCEHRHVQEMCKKTCEVYLLASQ